MKDNKCKTVMGCFQDILTKCGEKPQQLNSDRGSELICKEFKRFLKKKNSAGADGGPRSPSAHA